MERPTFGTVLGSYKGVNAFCNRSAGWGAGPNFVDGIYTGYKYQCVEFARRWLVKAKGLTFDDVNCAYHIWRISSLTDIHTHESVPLVGLPNGGNHAPCADAILIFQSGPGVPWGHVAIITEVNKAQGYVRIADQNDVEWHWHGNYSRQLRLEVANGKYHIRDKYQIIGWMVYENFENALAS